MARWRLILVLKKENEGGNEVAHPRWLGLRLVVMKCTAVDDEDSPSPIDDARLEGTVDVPYASRHRAWSTRRALVHLLGLAVVDGGG